MSRLLALAAVVAADVTLVDAAEPQAKAQDVRIH